MDQKPALKLAREELERGRTARTNGNEGMARVCARRAAGHALGAYLENRPELRWGASALNRLAGLSREEAAPADARRAAEHLIARITPEHGLPSDEDPLGDAAAIIQYVERALG